MPTPISQAFSECAVYRYHTELFSPLPPQGQAAEIAKKIVMAVIAPLAYFVLMLTAPIEMLLGQRLSSYQGVYFVRFINVTNANPTINDLSQVINQEIRYHTSQFAVGASLVTPNSLQPLATQFTPQHKASHAGVATAYPFALLINPKVTLQYWSLGDMDRAQYRTTYENAMNQKSTEFTPNNNSYHTGGLSFWRRVHFTGIQNFINKVNLVAQAGPNGSYKTTGGKNKPVKGDNTQQLDLRINHNEGAISYNPKQDVQGILIRNTPQDIALAEQFKKANKDFANTPLFHQTTNGQIARLL